MTRRAARVRWQGVGTDRFWSVVRIEHADDDGKVLFERLDDAMAHGARTEHRRAAIRPAEELILRTDVAGRGLIGGRSRFDRSDPLPEFGRTATLRERAMNPASWGRPVGSDRRMASATLPSRHLS